MYVRIAWSLSKREIVRGRFQYNCKVKLFGGHTCPLSKVSNGKKYFVINWRQALEKILKDTKLRGHLSGEQAVPS